MPPCVVHFGAGLVCPTVAGNAGAVGVAICGVFGVHAVGENVPVQPVGAGVPAVMSSLLLPSLLTPVPVLQSEAEPVPVRRTASVSPEALIFEFDPILPFSTQTVLLFALVEMSNPKSPLLLPVVSTPYDGSVGSPAPRPIPVEVTGAGVTLVTLVTGAGVEVDVVAPCTGSGVHLAYALIEPCVPAAGT